MPHPHRQAPLRPETQPTVMNGSLAPIEGLTHTAKILPQIDLSAVKPRDEIIKRRTENLAMLIEKLPAQK